MSHYLDRLFRLIDLVDLRVYRRLVITSLSDDLRALKSIFGDKETLYVILTDNVVSGGNVLALPTPDVGGLWVSVDYRLISKLLSSIEPLITCEVLEAIIVTGARPADLRLVFEVLTEVRRVCSKCRVITVVNLPVSLDDVAGVNLLSFITVISKRGLSDVILLVSDRFMSYLKLIRSPNTLITCFNVLLGNYGHLYDYLKMYRRVGTFACLPDVDIEMFGDLTNSVKFLHHLMGDYECRIERLLVITSFSIGSLDEACMRLRSLGSVEPSIIPYRVTDTDYVVIVEPGGYLVRNLGRYVTGAYDVVKVLDADIGIDYILGMVTTR